MVRFIVSRSQLSPWTSCIRNVEWAPRNLAPGMLVSGSGHHSMLGKGSKQVVEVKNTHNFDLFESNFLVILKTLFKKRMPL